MDETSYSYRINFQEIDGSGQRTAVPLPGGAYHLLYLKDELPLLPRVGEILTLQADQAGIYNDTTTYKVAAVEHSITSRSGQVVEHHVTVALYAQ